MAIVQLNFPDHSSASKPILCRKAEGILGFTYVTENGAGNIELPVCFLYYSLQPFMFEASLISYTGWEKENYNRS